MFKLLSYYKPNHGRNTRTSGRPWSWCPREQKDATEEVFLLHNTNEVQQELQAEHVCMPPQSWWDSAQTMQREGKLLLFQICVWHITDLYLAYTTSVFGKFLKLAVVHYYTSVLQLPDLIWGKRTM